MPVTGKLSIKICSHRPERGDNELPPLSEMNLALEVMRYLAEYPFTWPFLFLRNDAQSRKSVDFECLRHSDVQPLARLFEVALGSASSRVAHPQACPQVQ